jgi:hypothetical protein
VFAIPLTVLLGGLLLLHAYWALGGRWGSAYTVPTINGRRSFRIPATCGWESPNIRLLQDCQRHALCRLGLLVLFTPLFIDRAARCRLGLVTAEALESSNRKVSDWFPVPQRQPFSFKSPTSAHARFPYRRLGGVSGWSRTRINPAGGAKRGASQFRMLGPKAIAAGMR